MTFELTDAKKIERIRTLNDIARQNPGAACRANMTIGFTALEGHDRQAAVRQIIAFDQFDEGNDPHGEQDFGTCDVAGRITLRAADSFKPLLFIRSERT